MEPWSLSNETALRGGTTTLAEAELAGTMVSFLVQTRRLIREAREVNIVEKILKNMIEYRSKPEFRHMYEVIEEELMKLAESDGEIAEEILFFIGNMKKSGEISNEDWLGLVRGTTGEDGELTQDLASMPGWLVEEMTEKNSNASVDTFQDPASVNNDSLSIPKVKLSINSKHPMTMGTPILSWNP